MGAISYPFQRWKNVQCLYCQKIFQYKRDQVFNYFGYNAKSTLIVCPKMPPVVKQKFISCGNIVPTRMSALELWGTRGPLGSIGIAYSS